MEKDKSYEGLTIRIPSNVAQELKKLKNDRDLPSYGLALQYWVRQQIDEQIASRLIKLEELMNKVAKGFDYFEDRIMRADEKSITNSGWLGTILEKVDGKGGSDDLIERIQRVNTMPKEELFEERKKRQIKIEELKREHLPK